MYICIYSTAQTEREREQGLRKCKRENKPTERRRLVVARHGGPFAHRPRAQFTVNPSYLLLTAAAAVAEASGLVAAYYTLLIYIECDFAAMHRRQVRYRYTAVAPISTRTHITISGRSL